MKQEHCNDAYARLGYARGKTIKQQNINQIDVPLSWPTFDNYSSDALLDLQDPKTVTDPDVWSEIKCPAEIKIMLKLNAPRLLKNRSHHISIAVPALTRLNLSFKDIILIMTSTASHRHYLIPSRELLTWTNSQPRSQKKPVWKILKMA